jgi:hypothetical protein
MPVTITKYGGPNNYWNAGPSEGDVRAEQVLVDKSSNASTLNLRVYTPDGLITGTLTGSFQFNGTTSTMEAVSGTLYGLTSYVNGVLSEISTFTQGVNVNRWLFPSTTQAQYVYQAEMLYEGINLTGSQSVRPKWGDTLIGGFGKDSFTSFAGKVTSGDVAYFDGKGGVDTAVFQGTRSQYTVTSQSFTDQTDMSYKNQVDGYLITDSIKSRNGFTQVTNVERLKFSDTTVAFDIGANQTAGSGYMLYKAAFNRTPDASGLGFWINQMDTGMSYSDVANNFVNSAEFKTAFGGSNPTVNTLVTKLYNNVLNRTPDAGGLAFWQEKLTTGWSTADVLGYFSTSAENVTNVTPLIANGIQYQQFVG